MKIAIVTMEVKSMCYKENFDYMMEMIERAKQDHADLIVFPQNAISGYYLGDAWKDPETCRYIESFNAPLIQASEDLAIVWGNIKYRNGKLFNCAFFAYQKETHMRVKTKETHAFAQDEAFDELNINSAIPYQNQVFALNFGTKLQLSDWNINLDAKPYDLHNETKFSGNVIYVNAVGMQNVNKAVMMMEGGSAVVCEGKYLWQMTHGESGYALVDLSQKTFIQPKQRNLLVLLKQAIKGFDEQILGGKAPWIVGLSGGLDSSVSAALLVSALGKNRVIGYGMSSVNNSEQTKENARLEAKRLDIAYHEGSIQPLVDATNDILHAYGYNQIKGLALENIQARVRGHLLSGFASLVGGVVVNNGNKVENALGYCTLYGDAIGAIGILGDLTKVQLFDLAKQLNGEFQKEVVPTNLLGQFIDGRVIFDVAPTAELKTDQKDPMKWFYHDYLVDHLGRDLTITEFLNQYLFGSVWKSEISEIMKFYHLDDPKVFVEDFQWFYRTAKRNSFKHTQVPLILTLTQNGYALRKEVQGSMDLSQIEKLLDQINQLKKS